MTTVQKEEIWSHTHTILFFALSFFLGYLSFSSFIYSFLLPCVFSSLHRIFFFFIFYLYSLFSSFLLLSFLIYTFLLFYFNRSPAACFEFLIISILVLVFLENYKYAIISVCIIIFFVRIFPGDTHIHKSFIFYLSSLNPLPFIFFYRHHHFHLYLRLFVLFITHMNQKCIKSHVLFVFWV